MLTSLLRTFDLMTFSQHLKIHKFFIPLIVLVNILGYFIAPYSTLFDSALFRLQLTYPAVGFEPYKDFVFIYPFGPSLISIGINKLTHGFVSPINLIWLIHLFLQIILVKKILQNRITSSSKIPFLYFMLIAETLIFAKLGGEPFSLILTFITLIEFFKAYQNKKIYLATFIYPTLLIFFRWDRLLFCSCVILLFIVFRQINGVRHRYLNLIKIAFIPIFSLLFLLLSFYIFNPSNFVNIITYVFIDPFTIAKYRSLPFILNQPILSIYNLYYLVLIIYMCIFALIISNKVEDKKIFFYCMGFSLLPPSLSRSDIGHFIPFYFSSFFLIYSVPVFIDKYLARHFNKLLFLIKFTSLILITSFIIFELKNTSLSNSCSNFNVDNPKSIFVGNAQYDRFTLNFPLLYLNYSYLKPATKYISDEPGLQNTCAIGDEIINDLVSAPKPTIFFINKTLITDKNNKVLYSNCGKIEEYIINHTKIIGQCILSDYNLDVRLSK